MARHARINRFVNPDSARGLSDAVLAEFLQRIGDFARSAGVLNANSAVDLRALHAVLASPRDSTPQQLVDAMVMLDNFGDANHFDALLDELRALDITIPDEASTSDLALTLYMHDPDVLERLYAERLPIARRRFESYFSTASAPARLPQLFADADVEDLRRRLEDDFARRGRGASVRVHTSFGTPWHRLVVRRGDVLHRESAVDSRSGETHQVTFCPERFDVVLLHQTSGEMLVNARTRADTNAYLALVGGVLIGDPTVFRAEGLPDRFSYEPVWPGVSSGLDVGDTPVLSSVTAVSLEWSQGRSRHLNGRLQGDGLLDTLRAGLVSLPYGARATGLAFQMSFRDGRTTTVRLRSPNAIVFGYEGDIEIIMRWLAIRGFARTREEAMRGLTGSVLAHTRGRSRRR